MLKNEFGTGLRSAEILNIKSAVSRESPQLYSLLYYRGGVTKSSRDVYNGWRKAGFMAWEARELTQGHTDVKFNSQAVYDSIPGQLSRKSRTSWVNMMKKQGWKNSQIRRAISDYYAKGLNQTPWSFLRAEYKDKKKIDFVDYSEKLRNREQNKINGLYKKG